MQTLLDSLEVYEAPESCPRHELYPPVVIKLKLPYPQPLLLPDAVALEPQPPPKNAFKPEFVRDAPALLPKQALDPVPVMAKPPAPLPTATLLLTSVTDKVETVPLLVNPTVAPQFLPICKAEMVTFRPEIVPESPAIVLIVPGV